MKEALKWIKAFLVVVAASAVLVGIITLGNMFPGVFVAIIGAFTLFVLTAAIKGVLFP